MSNMSTLIANDVPGPAGCNIGRKPKGRDVVADGPMSVPVFWLALFDDRHFTTFELKDDEGDTLEVPSLVAELAEARELLRRNRALLAEYFPEFQGTFDEFAKVVDRLKSRYIKADLEEIWDIATIVGQDSHPTCTLRSAGSDHGTRRTSIACSPWPGSRATTGRRGRSRPWVPRSRGLPPARVREQCPLLGRQGRCVVRNRGPLTGSEVVKTSKFHCPCFGGEFSCQFRV